MINRMEKQKEDYILPATLFLDPTQNKFILVLAETLRMDKDENLIGNDVTYYFVGSQSTVLTMDKTEFLGKYKRHDGIGFID